MLSSFLLVCLILAYLIVAIATAGVSSAIASKNRSDHQADGYIVVICSVLWPIALAGLVFYFLCCKGIQRLIRFIAVKLNPNFYGWY